MTYPDELPAKVLALVEGEGYSIRAAAERTGVAVTTAWQWVQQANRTEQGNKPILDRYQRRVVKALDLMDRGLDVIADDESNQLAYKSLQQLNFIAGTGTDKLQKDSEKPSIQAQNVTINVYGEPPPHVPLTGIADDDCTQYPTARPESADLPPVIEGEVKDA